MKRVVVVHKCGAIAELLSPEGDEAALERKRQETEARDCPHCEGEASGRVRGAALRWWGRRRVRDLAVSRPHGTKRRRRELRDVISRTLPPLPSW